MESNNKSDQVIIKKEFFIRQVDGQITQDYEVIKKIGEGASAKVYKVKEIEKINLTEISKEINNNKNK